MYHLEQLEDADTGERFTMLTNGEGSAETEVIDALIRLRAHDPNGYEVVANLIEHLIERHASVESMSA